FTPLTNGLVAISTCGSDFDTMLQIYTGVCGSLTPVICNDNNGPVCGGNAASVAFNGTAGTTYWILAGGFAGSTSGGNLSIVASVAGLMPSLIYPQWNTGQFSFRLQGE